jgi:AraC-like DNA-binding protein
MPSNNTNFFECTTSGGITLLKSENNLKKNIFFDRSVSCEKIQFHFVLNGEINFHYNNGAYSLNVTKGNYIVLYNPDKELPINAENSPQTKILSIIISIKKFHNLFSEENDIQFLKDENINKKYYAQEKISNPVFITLNDLFLSFGKNIAKNNLYLKAKTYELFSYIYDSSRDTNIEKCPFLTNEENFNKIKMAKEIALKNLLNPPTLLNLSKEINLSLKKLKEGFKKIYGKTVYQFLLDHKMELAKKLLSERKKNVNEVSIKLGYSTASHFIAAFKNKYGVTPKTYSKNLN